MLEWVVISSPGDLPLHCVQHSKKKNRCRLSVQGGLDAPLGPHMGEGQGAPQSLEGEEEPLTSCQGL